MLSVGNRIEKYLLQEDWQIARAIILKELKKTPGDHWLLTRLSLTYYEEHKYKKALKIVEKALKYAPKCPLVLWDYAGTLDMIGQHQEAIKIWKRLLRIGIDKIAYGECGEGLRWARSLLNDSRYRIGRSYRKMGKLKQASNYIFAHISHRTPGTPSIYLLSTVKRELNDIERKKGDNSALLNSTPRKKQIQPVKLHKTV
jgi:tetratricopeptide (TPR) repeat protein